MKIISFDRGLRVLGHPLHAAVCHFPMGLLVISAAWDLIAMECGEPWWSFGYWSIALGLSIGCVAMVSGAMDFMGIPKNAQAEKPALIHMSFMAAAMGLFCAGIIFRSMIAQHEGDHVWAILGIDILGGLLLSIGGWFGGELVFKHRVGCINDESALASSISLDTH